jgi:rsbT co-antagonist protein RsbR
MIQVNRTLSKFVFTENDAQYVREAGELLKDYIPVFINSFYEWLAGQEEYQLFFADNPASMARVKDMQSSHWHKFFKANVDQEYFSSRRHVGAVHARINLGNDIYCAGMSISGNLLIKQLRSIKTAPAHLDAIIDAVNKLIAIDTYLALDEIANVKNKELASYTQTLMAMSTPVIPIWEDILLLPILGIVDSSRSQDIMNKTLAKIAETSAKVFIMDISGVAAMDTAVANQLIKITKATQLMGCISIISGISPEVAYTLVELGVQVGDVKTTGSLRDAAAIGLELIGAKIINDQSI